jgi:dynein heavy chain
MKIDDPNHIASFIAASHQSCFQLNKKLNEDYPDTAAVAQELRANIDVFSKNLPLIKCFTSDAITDEDWNDIRDAVGIPTFDREEIRISQFEELELFKFVEEIEEITMKAEKKFSLAQKLKGMRDEMKIYSLQQAPYKEITWLIKGFDDINSVLDDQIVATQAMLGSSFMRGKLKNETKNWEKKLNDMSELMEEVLKV